MKKLLVASALALALSAANQQSASAWCNFKFGVGLNIEYSAGNNSFLWGLWHNGATPDCFSPMAGSYAPMPPMYPQPYGYAPSYAPSYAPQEFTPPAPTPVPAPRTRFDSTSPIANVPVGYYYPQAAPASYYPMTYSYTYPASYYPMSYSYGYPPGFSFYGN